MSKTFLSPLTSYLSPLKNTQMKSILEDRPALAAVINDVAEVTGYLWQNGWAERNGGNITVNITEFVDAEMAAMPAIVPVQPIGKVLPYLKGK